jgi:hypothetical protein
VQSVYDNIFDPMQQHNSRPVPVHRVPSGYLQGNYRLCRLHKLQRLVKLSVADATKDALRCRGY